MKKMYLSIMILLLMVFMTLNTKTLETGTTSDLNISMKNTSGEWTVNNPALGGSISLDTQNTYSGSDSLKLSGTVTAELNLTTNNMEYMLTNDSLLNFTWEFQSNQYDYIGLRMLTPAYTYYVISYFGTTLFTNGSTSGIFEYTNEQVNIWYNHQVNLTALFLQSFNNLPKKLTGIQLINAFFDPIPTHSNQVSYFGAIHIYTPTKTKGKSSTIPVVAVLLAFPVLYFMKRKK